MKSKSMSLPNGKNMALSIVVNVEEGSEMTIARGDRGMEPVDELGVFIKSPIRNYGNESNYLYGIKEGAPRIIDLLSKYQIKASWTAAAMSLENHSDLAEAIKSLEHETVSHGWRWIHQFKMDEDQEREFIRRAVSSIESTTGMRPYGWLSRYFHTENTRRLLIEEGFKYHMDDYSSDIPFWDKETNPEHPIVILPYQLDNNDMKMWISPSYTPDAWLEYARRGFDWVLKEGREGKRKMMSLGLHLRIIGRPGRIWALEEFFKHVTQFDDVWIATRFEICEYFKKANPS